MKKLFSNWKSFLGKGKQIKKTHLVAGLALSFFSLVVYAVGMPYVGVNVNDTSIPLKTAGSFVTATEFNTLTNTVRGIFNSFDGTSHRIGLNRVPSLNIDFDVNGDLRLGGTTEACNASAAGVIYFNDQNHKFWGCDGTNWVNLSYIGNGGSGNYQYACLANGNWQSGAACASVDYDSSRTYTQNDKVCAAAEPDPATCAATASARLFQCTSSGTWLNAGTCNSPNYVSGNYYSTNQTVCASATPNDDDCTGGDAGTCTPTNANYEKKCDGNIVKWYNNCGGDSSIVDVCTTSCSNNETSESLPSTHPEHGTRNKYDARCESGFSPMNSCSGDIPANATMCAGDEGNGTVKLVDSCSPSICEWVCDAGYARAGRECKRVSGETEIRRLS